MCLKHISTSRNDEDYTNGTPATIFYSEGEGNTQGNIPKKMFEKPKVKKKKNEVTDCSNGSLCYPTAFVWKTSLHKHHLLWGDGVMSPSVEPTSSTSFFCCRLSWSHPPGQLRSAALTAHHRERGSPCGPACSLWVNLEKDILLAATKDALGWFALFLALFLATRNDHLMFSTVLSALRSKPLILAAKVLFGGHVCEPYSRMETTADGKPRALSYVKWVDAG